MNIKVLICWISEKYKSSLKVSFRFDEPLQEVELVKEKTVEFPSYSTEYLDDEIRGDDPDLDPMISDISVQKSSYADL